MMRSLLEASHQAYCYSITPSVRAAYCACSSIPQRVLFLSGSVIVFFNHNVGLG